MKFETVEEFKARGGKVQMINITKETEIPKLGSWSGKHSTYVKNTTGEETAAKLVKRKIKEMDNAEQSRSRTA